MFGEGRRVTYTAGRNLLGNGHALRWVARSKLRGGNWGSPICYWGALRGGVGEESKAEGHENGDWLHDCDCWSEFDYFVDEREIGMRFLSGELEVV